MGEGFGEYSLCVSLQSGAGAVAVEVNLFAPFLGMVDPRTVTDVAADGKEAKAVAEDAVPWLIRTDIPPPLQYPVAPYAFDFCAGLIRMFYGLSLWERAKF